MPIKNLDKYFKVHRPEQCLTGTKFLLKKFRALKPEVYLEIGCAHLDTFRIYESHLPKDGLAIGVDLKVYSPWKTYQPDSGCQVSLFEGGSDNPQVIKKVKNVLGNQKIDFLFIDGCHDYDEVRSDWDNYSPLVRKGGMIVFHDVDYAGARKYGKTVPFAKCGGYGAALVVNEIKARTNFKVEAVPNTRIGTEIVWV